MLLPPASLSRTGGGILDLINNLSQALSALDEDFSRIDDYHVVPDGEYWTVVEDVALDVAQFTGSPRIVWKLRILRADQFGRRLQRTLVITKTTLRWLKRDFYLCGITLESLQDLPGRLENIPNLKALVRKQSKAVNILDIDAPVSAPGSLFLHLIDPKGQEYLDQQLRLNRRPKDRHEFEAIIDHYVTRYQCPRPSRAFLEDSKSGATLFSTDPAWQEKATIGLRS